MKALTLWQPWASLIAIGAKRIETRSWSTSYRGPFAIHASARTPEMFEHQRGWIGSGGLISQLMMGKWSDELVHADPCDCDHDDEVAGERCMAGSDWSYSILKDEGAHGFSLATTLPLGAIVATCELVGVVPIAERPDPTRRVVAPGALGGEVGIYNLGAGTVRIFNEAAFGNFTPGRSAWLLDNIQPLDPPVPAKGRQGLWEWTPEAVSA